MPDYAARIGPELYGTMVEVPGLEQLSHKPLVALYDRDLLRCAFGSTEPVFILYEDGLVYFHKYREPNGITWHEGNIGPEGTREFVNQLFEVAGLDNSEGLLEIQDPWIGMAGSPSVRLMIRIGARWKWWGAARTGCWPPLDPREGLFGVYPPLDDTYKWLWSYWTPNHKNITSEVIQVRFKKTTCYIKALDWPASLPVPIEDPIPGRWTANVFIPNSLSDLLQPLRNHTVKFHGSSWIWNVARQMACLEIPEVDYLNKVAGELSNGNGEI